MRWCAGLVFASLLLMAACSGGDDGVVVTPAATETPLAVTPTATAAATAATTPTQTVTPAPTPPPPPTPRPGEAVFCDAAEPIDGRTGSIREGDSRDPRCTDTGFVTNLSPERDAAIAIGDFVPHCLQPAGDSGFVVSVGVLCVSRSPSVITNNPLPPELRGVIEDGDFVPSCRISLRPDWEIVIGPPCVSWPGVILTDSAPLESLADCTAGLTFMSDVEALFRPLSDALIRLAGLQVTAVEQPSLLGDSDFLSRLDQVRVELTTSRGQLAALEPGVRAIRYLEPSGDLSAIVINARALEALDGLLAALSADGLVTPGADLAAALLSDVDAAIHWFALGRGCGG